MKRTICATLTCALMLLMSSAPAATSQSAQQGDFGKGIGVGSAYRTWPDSVRQFYVAGIVDGLLFSPAVGGRKKFAASLNDCLGGVTVAQVAAAVDKNLATYPARWEAESMNSLTFVSLVELCVEKGKPLMLSK